MFDTKDGITELYSIQGSLTKVTRVKAGKLGIGIPV